MLQPPGDSPGLEEQNEYKNVGELSRLKGFVRSKAFLGWSGGVERGGALFGSELRTKSRPCLAGPDARPRPSTPTHPRGPGGPWKEVTDRPSCVSHLPICHSTNFPPPCLNVVF